MCIMSEMSPTWQTSCQRENIPIECPGTKCEQQARLSEAIPAHARGWEDQKDDKYKAPKIKFQINASSLMYAVPHLGLWEMSHLF